jgi:hypothetical protein
VPRDAITLADVREPTLTIVCEPRGRHGRLATIASKAAAVMAMRSMNGFGPPVPPSA